MAGADYYSCDVCGSKAFYDANLNYDFDNRDARGNPKLDYVGDMACICDDCAKTRKVEVVAIAAPTDAKPLANVSDMVNRFLGWKLPQDFAPDAGISFAPSTHPLGWPVGTNLLTADQAKAMFLHCLGEGAA